MTTADARIRRFSTITFLAGSVVAVVLAFIVVPFVGINPATGELLLDDPNEYEYRPWADPAAQEVGRDGDTLIGAAGTRYLDIPAGDDVWVIGPLTEGQQDYLSIHQQIDADASTADDRPAYIGLVSGSRSLTFVAGDDASRLWFAPRLTDWSATVTRETPTPVDGATVSGEGSALLVYDGEALSARFVYAGDGFFGVEAVYPGEAALDVVQGFDAVDTRSSWPPSDRVVLRVDSDEGSGKWTIRFDEPASDSP
ncbi:MULTISPECIES: hypothetical protein [unclassified Microbacterium]|uniref:hypothetical protein n=1 Tax=unclassified Microbacterium TaxID=2609290 RepID=UPI0003697581|nr:hypothetical protein [Microbacterium sp. 77mftsu3.1]SDG56260.1 hypothetical protein SAMN04488590_1111 [Microbacterium sp. 77mftsu3.1]